MAKITRRRPTLGCCCFRYAPQQTLKPLAIQDLMKKITKICLSIFLIDVAVYFILFHSGIVLPFINPSVEEYSRKYTSFPRNYAQIIYWIVVHYPSSFIISSINERLLVLSAVQYPIIIFGLNKAISKMQRRRGKLVK